ncbi:hypothetical protein D9613_007676 [Agrocybe pediades]|uniref:Uncharacterized protein n=1 Tax=Agrocybe pediades TaxID=84607 RepID=A0A8H4QN04_9AGAR|nr:hypothetical protein D9613_007676 [Agrocybe pediades]
MRQFNVVVLGGTPFNNFIVFGYSSSFKSLKAGGVGKSALTVRFVRDVFVETYDPTIEEEFRRTVLVDGRLDSVSHLLSFCGRGELKLEVLDTAGAEQFTSLNEVYIKSARGFLLVFSLTQEATLQEVDHLRKQIIRIKGGDTSTPMVIVATKLDLANEREVPIHIIQSLADQWRIPFYETSAKRNWHIEDVFADLTRQMRQKYPVDPSRGEKKRTHSACTIM